MKTAVKKIFQYPLTPYLVLFFCMLAVHLHLSYVPGDEVQYAAAVQGPFDFPSMARLAAQHYNSWSSRFLTESLFCVFSSLPPLIWRLANPLVITGLALLTGYFCGAAGMGIPTAKKPFLYSAKGPFVLSANWLICIFFWLYSWPNLSTAGWIVTSIAYLWTSFFLLAALLPLLKALRGRRSSPALWAAALAAQLFATNMEQGALLFLFLLLGALVCFFIKEEKLPVCFWVQAALCIGMLVFIFTCPGNAVRAAVETTSFYPDYPMLSLFHKIEIGISSVVAGCVFGRDLLFYFFALLLCVGLFIKKAPLPARILGCLPPLILLPFSVFRYELKAFFPGVALITEAFDAGGYLKLTNAGDPKSYLAPFLGYGIFALCLISLYALFGFSRRSAVCWFLLLAGAASWAAVAFSPSIGVSGPRTGCFFSFCLVAVSALVWQGLPRRRCAFFWCACAAASCLQFYSLWQMG